MLHLAVSMLGLKKKNWYRVNIKSLLKLKNSATKTINISHEVHAEDALSRSDVFEWHKRSLRNDVENYR